MERPPVAADRCLAAGAVRSTSTRMPDEGAVARHESAGAIAIGARDVLIAFNIELASGDLTPARRIARAIRERDGGLRTLACARIAADGDRVQVSLNVTDYAATPLYRVVELVGSLPAQLGIDVLGCELIGCLPLAAVEAAAAYYLGVTDCEVIAPALRCSPPPHR